MLETIYEGILNELIQFLQVSMIQSSIKIRAEFITMLELNITHMSSEENNDE